MLLKELGFRGCILNKRHVIRESLRIVEWIYSYLNRINCLKAAGFGIIILDKTWYDTHGVVNMGWDDGSCSS